MWESRPAGLGAGRRNGPGGEKTTRAAEREGAGLEGSWAGLGRGERLGRLGLGSGKRGRDWADFG